MESLKCAVNAQISEGAEETITREEAVERLLALFKENTDILIETVDELDRMCDILEGYERYLDMDNFSEFVQNWIDRYDVEYMLEKVLGGYDEYYGRISSFHLNRNYFYIDGYGHPVSTDAKNNYSGILDEEFCEQVIDNVDCCNFDSAVVEIIDCIK